MAARVNILVGRLAAGLLISATAHAQKVDAPVVDGPSQELRANSAMLVLDYQVLHVQNDKPIDLLGFHLHNKVADWLYVGAGLYAPLLKGAYGGFTAFDIAAHVQQRLSGRLFATAGLSLGGGAGGRSVERARELSGTGSFFKAYAGLGYDFGSFSAGANVSRMKFSQSAINGTQANVFLQIPYTYFTGAFASHGQQLAPTDARLAAASADEKMLTVAFDNFRQRKPEGTYKGSFNIVDLQYAHYFARDTYWFADLGVGYRGLPLSNQVFGGVGQRVQLSPSISLYGQLGVGSGIYAPEVIDTKSGLLVYPKLSAEIALTKDLGLSLSAGYLAAPRGTSRNQSIGLALTQHIRGGGGGGGADAGGAPTYQAFRVSLFQQTDFHVRYRDIDRGQLQMIGIQADAMLNQRWYIPLQASIAYTSYLGYPGYGELLGGLGVQSLAGHGDRWQVFAELMAGTNVHGLAAKGSGGVRYTVNERSALHVAAGHMEARSSSGNRFITNSVNVGLDWRFSLPVW